jgi:hypothetical protein
MGRECWLSLQSRVDPGGGSKYQCSFPIDNGWRGETRPLVA